MTPMDGMDLERALLDAGPSIPLWNAVLRFGPWVTAGHRRRLAADVEGVGFEVGEEAFQFGLTVCGSGRIVRGDGRSLGRREPTMTILDLGKLVLIVATPTLLGAVAIYAPKLCGAIVQRWQDRHAGEPQPIGPPIEQLAADLRRLLRLHGELTTSAHLAMRAHRLWAVEAAIGVRAVEAARALGLPHREPDMPGALTRDELVALLRALAAAGVVLPAKVGPFTSDGRL